MIDRGYLHMSYRGRSVGFPTAPPKPTALSTSPRSIHDLCSFSLPSTFVRPSAISELKVLY